jgi:hypothetical protein
MDKSQNTPILLTKAESPMTSSDLIIPVQTTHKQMTVRVILIKGEDLATGEAEKRFQGLSTAVRPANPIEIVLLVHDLDQAGAQGCLPAIMRLQKLLVVSLVILQI